MFKLLIILIEIRILQDLPQVKLFYFIYFDLLRNLIKPVSYYIIMKQLNNRKAIKTNEISI